MSSILLITSSPRGEASHSKRLATELGRRLQTARPGATLVTRDLARDPLPHIGGDFTSGLGTPEDRRSPEQARAVAASDAAIEELLAADTIVLATGMINFGIASTLKSWFDHVARAGRTFRYTESGPVGLVGNKQVYLVLASGGVYSDDPSAAFDHAVPYVRSLFAFLGVPEVEVIRIEGVALGAEAERAALARAEEQVSGLALAA